jgi:hypothetical protein
MDNGLREGYITANSPELLSRYQSALAKPDLKRVSTSSRLPNWSVQV